ncbi:MAG: VF530 family DNA-binding protein [Kiritimatiellales bacterium]|nr:VF530 family DNA-binding protein [Kiritimatiellales bacterium]
MSIEEQQNNPLHGLSTETMVTKLVKFYGWDLLYAALGLNCFQTNPSVPSTVKFLKKTEWARYKVENFYLYRFCQMPKFRGEDFDMPPRARGFANGIVPLEPMELTFGMIAAMKEQAEEAYQARQEQSRQNDFQAE